MAYFSNGSEGTAAANRWCERCVHGVHQQPCPVMWLHLEWNYEQHPEIYEKRLDNASQVRAGVERTKRAALETLWPTGEDGWPAECKMFLEYHDSEEEQELDGG